MLASVTTGRSSRLLYAAGGASCLLAVCKAETVVTHGPILAVEEAPLEEQAKQYRVTSKWCGIFGGWGSERDIAHHIDESSKDGWELVRTENATFLWFWIIPRHKVLFIFAR